MDLVEDDALVFNQISNWLYTGKLNPPATERYLIRFQVYATAEKYGIVNLKNHFIYTLFKRAIHEQIIPKMDSVKYVYSTTPSNSPLRKLFVGLYIWYMDKELWASMVSSASLREVPDFAVDMAIALGNDYLGHDLSSSNYPDSLKDYLEEPILMGGQ